MPMIDLLAGRDPFVAFVGAGASALPPSKLPTWIEFNNLLLDCLCDRLSEYSGNRQPTGQMLSRFRARRDETHFFAPDFQAQLIEEEIGAAYFQVWQSLQTDAHGPVHMGLAELASRGLLRAIITTNFDQLIEAALREKGQAFKVFHNAAAFEALETAGGVECASTLPVIKIHGSIEDPTSLVDTLKQRVVGRPQSLMKVLQGLLQTFPWLYLGFSGADFSYDPHYLGILDAADSAKGFTFLAREGSRLQEGVHALAEAYGAEKGRIVYGDLSSWLFKAFGLPPWKPVPTIDHVEDDPVVRVRSKIRQWVEELGDIAVVNILFSMLKGSGLEADALWLLRKTWKSYRSGRDTRGKSYARYNYNYGAALLERGFVRNPVVLADDMANLLAWKEGAEQNAYEYLSRAYRSGNLISAGAHLGCVLAYRGEVGKAIALTSTVTDEALRRDAPLELCEIAIASAALCDISQMCPDLLFQRSLEIAKNLGDEPRRAMLCAHYGRFLTYGGRFHEAETFIHEGDRIAHRLDIKSALLTSQAAKGLWLTNSGTSIANGLQTLEQVARTIRALDDVPLVTKVDLRDPQGAPIIIKGRHPFLCRVLLDLNRAAVLARNSELVNRTLDELDELATVFLGYCPHYYLAHAWCLLASEGNHRELITDLIRRARVLGEEGGNPSIGPTADRAERNIGAAR